MTQGTPPLPPQRSAARAGRALVAGSSSIVEIIAAGELVEIAAIGCGIAQLGARPGEAGGR